jgi:hypothetical protein
MATKSVQNPFYGGGYTTPRHVFIPPSKANDLGDGHVSHPTGDPRFGQANGNSLLVPTYPTPAVNVAAVGIGKT